MANLIFNGMHITNRCHNSLFQKATPAQRKRPKKQTPKSVDRCLGALNDLMD